MDHDMNLAASSEPVRVPDPKRHRISKPRLGMVFRALHGVEFEFYLVDFNTAPKSEVFPAPAFRFKFGHPFITRHGMCLLGSTLYIFESGILDSLDYEKLDDSSRQSFKGTRSVFSLDLSLEKPALKTLPVCLLWSKESSAAIPTPKKNGDILVFARTLVNTPPYYDSGYSDFEVYNPLTGEVRALPCLHSYLIANSDGCRPDLVFTISSYAFLGDGRSFLVKVNTRILSIDIESNQGWQPIETSVLVDRWGHFHSFHEFWLTGKVGYYLPRGGKMFTEGAPSFHNTWIDDEDYGDYGDDDVDDGIHDNDFGYPFSSDLDDEPGYDHHQTLSTLVGDSSLCTVRTWGTRDPPYFYKIIVDLFELDVDKLRRGYDQGGCKLVSSVELYTPLSKRDFGAVALCAIDDHCSIAPTINISGCASTVE